MKYVIIYWSRYGNGKKIVNSLATSLQKKSAETQIFKTEETNPTAMPEADTYIFSAPTEAFSIQRDMKTFMKNLQGTENKKYALINTHGMKKNTLHKMEKILTKKNMIKVADIDFKVGDNAKTGDGLTEGWETKLNEFAEKL